VPTPDPLSPLASAPDWLGIHRELGAVLPIRNLPLQPTYHSTPSASTVSTSCPSAGLRFRFDRHDAVCGSSNCLPLLHVRYSSACHPPAGRRPLQARKSTLVSTTQIVEVSVRLYTRMTNNASSAHLAPTASFIAPYAARPHTCTSILPSVTAIIATR